jgi:hypothetical protein
MIVLHCPKIYSRDSMKNLQRKLHFDKANHKIHIDKDILLTDNLVSLQKILK